MTSRPSIRAELIKGIPFFNPGCVLKQLARLFRPPYAPILGEEGMKTSAPHVGAESKHR
jgi:hypothetical protein